MPGNYLTRIEKRIETINQKHRKQFIDPDSGNIFWSIQYQKINIGLFAIYDDPDHKGYLYGKPV